MDYDHYIAVDWSMRNMAIARMTEKSAEPIVIDVPSSVPELKLYLSQLKGTKILAFEEMHTAQWLYTELKDHADQIVICDQPATDFSLKGQRRIKLTRSSFAGFSKLDS